MLRDSAIAILSEAMAGLDQLENCTKFSLSQMKQYNLVWSTSGMAMAVLTLGILVALIFIRTYKTPLQRLFLWLTVFTLFDLSFNSMNIVVQPKLFNKSFCQSIGYADVCIFFTSMLLVSGIALYLLFVIYHLIQARPLPDINRFKLGAMEMVFLLAVIGIPPVALLRSRDNFGVTGPLCWIETVNISDSATDPCSAKNKGFEFKILCLYTAIMTLNVSIFVLLKTISCLLARHQRHVRSHHFHMAKRASLLLMFLIASFVINVVSLWTHYANLDAKAPFPVLIAMALLVPTSSILIPIGFMFYLSSPKKLKLKSIKKKLSKLKRHLSVRSSKITEMASTPGMQPSPDSPACQVQEDPSYTVSREFGYTGAFTKVSTTYGSIDQTTYSE